MPRSLNRAFLSGSEGGKKRVRARVKNYRKFRQFFHIL